MSSNLFFVFTPLQLFVAQQIVHHEKLTNCILIKGYVMPPHNQHFLEIYDFMEIEGMWDKKIIFPEIAQWDGLKINNFHDVRRAYNNYKFLRNIAEENNVRTIYLGEIQNQAYRFTDILFHRLGYKIAYFEDGLGHYINRTFTPDNSLLTRIKIWLRDVIYYLPIYHVKFAKWRYNVNLPNYSELHIYKRYSVIPVFNESYDVHLKVTPLTSKKIHNYLQNVCASYNGNENILIMTDPVRELIPSKYYQCYLDVIKESVESLANSKNIYIKFHPRDKLEDRKELENIINSIGKRIIVLGGEINIPVEYFLQFIKFEKIFIFNAATFFYNGYLYPKTDFIPLLPKLYEKCKAKGSGRIKKLELFIEFFDKNIK